MPDLRQSERAKLPDSAFAYVDSAGKRRLPIHDEAHVRNALARFNRVVFDDDASRDKARSRLLKAAKRYGIVPIGFVEGQIRPRLPTGQLTLMFTDVEDSSRHLAELGEGYGPLLNAVRRIERAATRAGGGVEVDARADEYFAVFKSAAAAVEAAVAIQHAMSTRDWPDGHRMRVRIGLHTGRPTPTPSGYQGISVNAASRLSACGHGGQILLSKAVRAALGSASAPELRHLGAYRLRGIPDEHDIYQVLGPELDEEFPPLRF
jgi:class 3 adenylate cyclase